jgi:hypothetical protein
MLARKQQVYLSKLAEQAKKPRSSGLLNSLTALDRVLSGPKAKAQISRATAIGAAVQSQIEEGSLSPVLKEVQGDGDLKMFTDDESPASGVPQDARAAFEEMKAAKDELRRMNGKKD